MRPFLSWLRSAWALGSVRPWVLPLALVVACVPSAQPPQAAVQGTLSLNDEAALDPGRGEFRVVFAGPRGEVEAGAQLSLVFSRPLRPLEVAGQETVPGILLDPPLPGSWRWVGSNALAFVPTSGTLPGATHVNVTVPRSLRALDGSTLNEEYRFDFSTPRPRVATSSPGSGQTGLGPGTSFELEFNQLVPREELAKRLSLHATTLGKKKPLGFSLELPDPKYPKHWRLRPQNPLPAASRLELVLSARTRGSEGPLELGQDQVLGFETYERLSVNIECSREKPGAPCEPQGGVWLSLSNPVKMRDLKKAVLIEPSTSIAWESWRDDDDDTSYVDLPVPLVPGRRFTVRVAAGLRDAYGQKLAQERVQALDVGDYQPRVEVGVDGDYFEPGARTAVPVASLNVRSYSLWSAPLSPSQAANFVAQGDDGESHTQALLASLGAQKRTITPTASWNHPGEERIDVAQALAKQGGRGPLLIAAEYQAQSGVERVLRVVQVTNLAISAKLSRGQSVVWITELGSGKPVEAAEVSVLGAVGGAPGSSWRTDRDGLVVLPPGALGSGSRDELNQLLVVAKKGNDWSYRSVGEAFSPWRLDVPTDSFGEPRSHGLLFTERGLYRPGDTVQLKGILRREGEQGNDVLADRKFKLRLRSPNWEILESYAITTNAFGAFAKSVHMPASSRLGNYRLELVSETTSDDERYVDDLASTHFELAEYKPNEIEAHAASDKPSYKSGEEARFEIRGDYLYGAPMAGATLSYQLSRSESYFAVPGAEGYTTSAEVYDSAYPERAPSSGLIDSGTGKLDAQGLFERRFPLKLPGQRGPELVSFDAEVADISRQTVASSSSSIVHAADHYVGLGALDSFFVDAAKPFHPRALVFSPEGQVLSGKVVDLSLHRRRWTLVRETSGGSSHSEVRLVEEKVGSCRISSAATPASCQLVANEPGYYLVLAQSSDARGRVARAALDLYALGTGDAASYWPDDDASSLELVANKKQYKPGDVARILVKSPFPSAEALVTVEADGVKSQRRLLLSGPTPSIEVPITEQMRPNAYVGVHLVRPRSAPLPAAGKADLGAPTFRTGYVGLSIDPELRRLAVELKPNKTSYGPGEELDLDLQVKAGSAGVQSEVTVYAVDEGVLSLIGYRTPDPLPVFTAPRPLRTALLESREDLGKVRLDLAQMLGIGPNKGAEGGGGGDEGGPRRDFRQSAYFNPAVLTGADGKAHVRFKLPQGLTTYRLMAVATTTTDRYGYAERRITTSKPLMARPALPRFLRAGDRAEAGLLVSAKDFGPATVDVRLSATGLGTPLNEVRKLTLDKNGSAEVRFPLHADSVGTAQFTFEVSSQSGGKLVKDSVVVERRIASPATLEAVALYGRTTGAVAERLGDLSAVRRDVGSLELRASSSALVGLDGGFEQLLEYPYGCTEQLTSRLLPLLPLGQLASAYGVKLPKDTKPLVEKGIADILGRQRGDGGFGMWPESQESSPWVTPYALWGLHEAKQRGFAVPGEALEQGKNYLRGQLAEHREKYGLAAAAFALDVLAVLGAADAGYATTLFEQRRELPAFSQALLLHAWALTSPQSQEAQTLAKELENQLHIEANSAAFVENLGDSYAVLMDSPARTTALVLRGLLAHEPKHPLAERLARGLLAARRQGGWRSTQETAFALLSLDAYQKAQEATVPDFQARFWQGETTLFSAELKGKSTRSLEKSVSLATLGAEPIVFEKLGSGTLFYEARLRYARKELPKEALDRGFFVQKGLRAVTPDELGAGDLPISETQVAEVTAGSLVLVDLVLVSAEPRDYVVLEDPLAAGLEAVDQSFLTAASWTRIPGSSSSAGDRDAQAHGAAFASSWHRRELRDDRVLYFIDHLPAGMYHYRYLARATTLGRFVVPPTRAEEMYTPEIFGRTGARTLEIR